MRSHLAVLVVVLLPACKAPPSQPITTVTGDTTTIAYPAGDSRLRTLNKVVEYGQVDGPDSTTFADISAFTVDVDGGLIVAEAEGSLRRFHADGTFDRAIARKGGGPGEIEQVTSLARLANGTLVARDLGNARLNFYSPDLAFERQWSLPPMSGYGRHPVTVLHNGQLLVELSPRMPEDGSDMPWPRPTYLRIVEERQGGDTIFLPTRYVERCPVRSNVKFRAGWFEDMRYFYVPKVQWALLPSGALVVGCPATPLVDVIGSEGQVTRIVFPWPAEEVSRGEAAQEVWMVSESQKRTLRGVAPEVPTIPEKRSAFVAILASQDGRIWVWRAPARVKEPMPPTAPPGSPAEWWAAGKGGTFDVFEADGTYLGSVQQPENMPYAGYPGTIDPIIRGDTVWAITENEDEVQTLSKLVVTPGLAPVWAATARSSTTNPAGGSDQ